MKSQELKNMSSGDLMKMKMDLLKEQFNLRMQKESAKAHLFSKTRRDIARINTFLRARKGEE